MSILIFYHYLNDLLNHQKEGITIMCTIGEVDGFTLCDSLAKLSEIERLTSVKSWNGYDADPISESVFNRARDVLLRLINQPNLLIALTANDSIQLEYYNDDDAYLEFEVFADKVKMFFLLWRNILYSSFRQFKQFKLDDNKFHVWKL